MRFTAVIAASAAVSGALAAHYEEPAYVTVDDKVYTSVKTCTDKPTYAPTEAPVYEPAPTDAPVYEPAPSDYPVSEVTYTSYDVITVTDCAEYVTDCPAETYTSAAYSVSTCESPAPTDYYVPPANTTDYYVPPAEYPTETEVAYPTETLTYYTTVCPGKDYCYATTVTSTYCPGKPTETAYVPEEPTYVPVPETTSTYCPETTTYVPEEPTYVPKPVPTYEPCPGGYDCPAPPSNETTYVPPPSYTGAASANAVSFGVAAVAGLAALFIAA